MGVEPEKNLIYKSVPTVTPSGSDLFSYILDNERGI